MSFVAMKWWALSVQMRRLARKRSDRKGITTGMQYSKFESISPIEVSFFRSVPHWTDLKTQSMPQRHGNPVIELPRCGASFVSTLPSMTFGKFYQCCFRSLNPIFGWGIVSHFGIHNFVDSIQISCWTHSAFPPRQFSRVRSWQVIASAAFVDILVPLVDCWRDPHCSQPFYVIDRPGHLFVPQHSS